MDSKQRYYALDGLRGVAALAVLLLHFGEASVSWIAPHGYLAVDFFFMLSGFVLGTAYDKRLRSGFSIFEFTRQRAIRLYPLVIAGAVIGALGYFKVYDKTTLVVIFVTGSLLIPTPLAPASEGFVAMPVNVPAWSLTAEFLGNIFYASISRFLGNAFLAALIVIFGVLVLVTAISFDGLNFGSYWPNVWGGVPRFGFSFFVGLALFRLHHAGYIKIAVPTWVLAVCLFLSFLVPVGIPLNWLYDFTVASIFYPAFICLGSNIDVGRSSFFWRAVGELSYPAYVLQGGIMVHAKAVPGHFGLTGVLALSSVVTMIVAYLIFAWLALKLYDEPVRRWLSGKDRLPK